MIVSKFPTGTKIYTDQATGLVANYVVNTPGSLTVNWVNPTSRLFKGTMIRYKAGSYPTSPTDGTQAYLGTGTGVTITGLTGGTTYYIRAFAKAANSSGTKIYYNVTTAGAQVTTVTSAAPVTGLVAAAPENVINQMYVNWVAPVGTYVKVDIIRKTGSYPTSSSDGTLVYTGTGIGFTDTGLSPNVKYYYRAFVSNGATYNSNTSQQVARNTLCTPTPLSLVSRTSNAITVSWGASPDPSKVLYVIVKQGSYPTSYTDGTAIYAASSVAAGSATAGSLPPGTNIYFRAFCHNVDVVWNSNTSQQLLVTTKAAATQMAITTSQVFTVPAGVTHLDAFLVGGGQAGWGGSGQDGGKGGQSGRTYTTLGVTVTPGQQISVVVGAGGVPIAGQSYGQGGITSFGGYATEAVKQVPPWDNWVGGSGGGAGAVGIDGQNWAPGGAGGADGANGQIAGGTPGGDGQYITTRAFQEAGNTLYSGGGGGGGAMNGMYNYVVGGAGGAGGGGSGTNGTGSPGGTNTGSGGSGGAVLWNNTGWYLGGAGGSGIVVLRWAEQG